MLCADDWPHVLRALHRHPHVDLVGRPDILTIQPVLRAILSKNHHPRAVLEKEHCVASWDEFLKRRGIDVQLDDVFVAPFPEKALGVASAGLGRQSPS